MPSSSLLLVVYIMSHRTALREACSPFTVDGSRGLAESSAGCEAIPGIEEDSKMDMELAPIRRPNVVSTMRFLVPAFRASLISTNRRRYLWFGLRVWYGRRWKVNDRSEPSIMACAGCFVPTGWAGIPRGRATPGVLCWNR